MIWLQNIYLYIHSFFEILTFRTMPKYDMINNDDEYEFIILNEKMKR